MPIDKKKIDTSLIDVANIEVLIEDILKTKETQLLDLNGRSSITIDEIRYLRDRFQNKIFFTKIIDNAEGSVFLNGILTQTEEVFHNAKASTIKQLAFFAMYYRNQLSLADSFDRILKNTDGIFQNWFNIHVKYNLLIKLEAYYMDTMLLLLDLYDSNFAVTILEEDIELEKKRTIKYIQKTFLPEFESFLQTVWEESFKNHSEFHDKINYKRKTILFE